MVSNITGLIVLTCFVIVSSIDPSCAEEDGSPVSIGTYRTLHSQVLNEERTLLINLPEGYDETTIRHPVLFVLYGGHVQGYFAESVHIVDRLHEAGLIPQLIIIGVKNADRYRDNLPVNRNGEAGGAGNFLIFFREELIPFVDNTYRTKSFRILLGPQAGASFGLYALMEHPDLFDVHIVTNPFWNRSVRDYFREKAGGFFGREGPLKNFLFITCNTSDDNETTMDYLHKFTAIVEGGKKRDFTFVLNRREDIVSKEIIPSPGLKKGLMTFFERYAIPDSVEIENLEDMKRYYQSLSREYGYEVDIPEFTLIRQGDRLQERKRYAEAIGLYEYVEKQYPQNLNSYHRLAELHRRRGNYNRSIRYYEQFLERRKEPFIEQRMLSLRRYIDESAAHAIEKTINDSGLDAAVAAYQKLRSGDRSRYYLDEREFNSLGYRYIERGMLSAAIAVFKMNVEMNPRSANAYDSLGEAYKLNKNREPAIECYKKSLELDPNNANAKKMLDELEKTGE